MTLALEILSWACIVVGGAFCLLSGIGLMRMPDVFTRMHAASLGDTLGAGLIILGLVFQAGLGADLVGVKLLLILVFLLFTAPVATHALSKAALLDGQRPWTADGQPPEATLERGDIADDDFLEEIRKDRAGGGAGRAD
ncbi:monovalent cation/H(+) antiporter subunit G [Roseospira goensis]|uniref:Multicomponent Na+:H+ antiporter subunit G n=1 Tax=Roseospira goensis TaxID=391922 RepID=A0A7W6RWC3_9PROT|nr:monovalent cation/H(+) antiporter subunit G [Roseospira goensis]MBB4284421.1 multicomponent Na+:H+ antiporter subunit G [Roseospira goensis]